MKLVSSQQMRSLDRTTIEKYGIASLDLMEHAGSGVADAVQRITAPEKGPVAIIAGRGNNGGDGLVCARHLIQKGYEVLILILSGPMNLSPDARANFELLAPLTTHIYTATDIADLKSKLPLLAQAACIVDAILGTGLDREVEGLAALAIDTINLHAAKKIAVDIPSGLSSDTGIAMSRAVQADLTVTFGLPKRGLFVGHGMDFTGRVEVVDIGIPKEEIDRIETDLNLIDPSMFSRYFGVRKPSSHKGTYGHVAVFAGSLGHLGAGYLSCLAALRAGCGLVTYCLPQKAFVRFDARYPEVMCDPIPDNSTARFHPDGLDAALEIAEGKSVIAIGPAIGTDKTTCEFVNMFVRRLAAPMVVDADGLNVLDLTSLKGRFSPTILTPHPGEMARLMGTTTKAVQSDRIGSATNLAMGCGATVILKGRGTIVASPEGTVAINPTGNAGMATAGMGDALTGIIASFLAQGLPVMDACTAAVYLHGVVGDMAAAELGERALITSDVIRKLGKAMCSIERPET